MWRGKGHFLREHLIDSFLLSFQNVSLNMQMSHYRTHAIGYWWLFLIGETERQVSQREFISRQMKIAVGTFLVGQSLLQTMCWQIYRYYGQEVETMGSIRIVTPWFLKLCLSKQNYVCCCSNPCLPFPGHSTDTEVVFLWHTTAQASLKVL